MSTKALMRSSLYTLCAESEIVTESNFSAPKKRKNAQRPDRSLAQNRDLVRLRCIYLARLSAVLLGRSTLNPHVPIQIVSIAFFLTV
jgi:hypothetical protein